MSYWQQMAKDLPDGLLCHPLAATLCDTLESTKPKMVESLKNLGDWEAYIKVRIGGAVDDLRDAELAGTDPQVAREMVMLSLFDTEPAPAEEYEHELGVADELEAFEDWLDFQG